MADHQRVSTNNMDKDIESLEKELKNLPTDLEDLQLAMRALSGCWSGPAWSEYMKRFTEDVRKMAELQALLEKIEKGLYASRDAYMDAEFKVKADLFGVLIV